jgi:hypothetical protein
MTKKLDTASISNALAQTAFFRPNKAEKKPDNQRATPPSATPALKDDQEPDTSEQTITVPVPERVPVRVGVPPPVPRIPKVKRLIRQRQPFDIYEDQYERLKKIAAEEKDFENGRGMSQMVRMAIDNYLKDHGIPQE